MRRSLMIHLPIILLIAFCACGAPMPQKTSPFSPSPEPPAQKTYAFWPEPEPPYERSHYNASCKTSVYQFHPHERVPLGWKAHLNSMSTKPVPVTLFIDLIGPYHACGPFRGIVSQDHTRVLGQKAVQLQAIKTNDWDSHSYPQLLKLPEQSGFYVLYTQAQTRNPDGTPRLSATISWVQVS